MFVRNSEESVEHVRLEKPKTELAADKRSTSAAIFLAPTQLTFDSLGKSTSLFYLIGDYACVLSCTSQVAMEANHPMLRRIGPSFVTSRRKTPSTTTEDLK